ncbi:hypothetical protein [Mesorhizobium captivum]|uniref:hypothetical protein n=1 Tax=Mesorhizobium captivum TaxID=3072319 RepID=UPI002A248B05|nr:hypothetical protein [Mesorhizobium sp. VK3C]MDX8449380.1 hypothetical protein [Mesorhizobium sp. VK3C]
MPEFTLETTYRLPVFRQRTYEAETPEAACRLAIEDYDWSDQKEDYESSGETFVTGIWQAADAAYRGSTVSVPRISRRYCSAKRGTSKSCSVC